MAATDQHYRNQRTLDIVFGVSCGALLLTTIWMLVQDYNRDFKAVQRKFRDVEATLAEREAVSNLPDSNAVERAMKLQRLAKRKLEVGGARAEEQALFRRLDELREKRQREGLSGDEKEELESGEKRARSLQRQAQLLTKKEEGKLSDPEAKELAGLNESLGTTFMGTFAAWRDKSGDDAERLKAQNWLDTGHAKFKANERALRARREAADDRYRGIKADLDAQMSYYNIAIDESGKEPETIRKSIMGLEGQLDEARKQLDSVDEQIKAEVDDVLAPLQKAYDERAKQTKDLNKKFDPLAKQAVQRGWQIGDTIRSLPIIDGFASPTKINQIWLPDLTIDYGGFKDVPRYDRCTTCHLGIDRANFTKEALASLGNEDESKRLTAKLEEAQKMLKARQDAGENLTFDPNYLPGQRSGSVWLVFWLMLGSSVVAAITLGALERSRAVGTNTFLIGLAASAITGLSMWLFSPATPKVKDIKLTPGEITQYCGHPRMELFVDSNSPHPMQKFGCTTCHAGQGSATDFKLSAHTPDNASQTEEWKKKYGWASSHYWDFPMLSKRFTESACLKCHHEVTDLITHGTKEEAPKLLKGYNLVKDLGCYGCHEIQGQKGGRAVGPDLRLEPSPALDLLSAADQEKAKADPANQPGNLRKVGPSLRRLSEKTTEDWTRRWVYSPRGFRPDTKMPHFYNLSTNNKEALPEAQKKFPDVEVEAISYYLLAESQKALDGKDFTREAVTTRGVKALQAKLVKSGLSEREAKDLASLSKRYHDLALLSAPADAARISELAREQLQTQERLVQLFADPARKGGQAKETEALGKKLEGVMKQLAERASPAPLKKDKLIDGEGKSVSLPDAPKDEKERKEQLVNGRRLFTEKGCLACHSHQATTKAADTWTTKVEDKDVSQPISPVRGKATFGPDLSQVHQKLLPGDKGRTWLVQWIMNPNVHHPRTRMPVTFLDVNEADAIAAWLLSQGAREYKGAGPGEARSSDVRALARVYLAKAPGMTPARLDKVLPEDGPLEKAGFTKEDLARLAHDADEQALAKKGVSEDSLKWYIGRKAIGRLGCYACHDVPGFETAKPIGVGLNDWGRKDADRLAFEDAAAYVKKAKEAYAILGSIPGNRQEVEKALKVRYEGKEHSHFEGEGDYLKALKELINQEDEIRAAEAAVLPIVTAVGKLKARIDASEDESDPVKKLKEELDNANEAVSKKSADQRLITEKILADEKYSPKNLDELKAALSAIEEARKAAEAVEKLKKKGLEDAGSKELAEAARSLKYAVNSIKEKKAAHAAKVAEVQKLPLPYEAIFFEGLEHHHREGFLHQKLVAPRSYDYNRIRPWDDRLRMPKFQFSRTRRSEDEDASAYLMRQVKEEAGNREAVMTFVLGLVAEPVPLKYVHAPKADRAAEVAGRQVLDKYNCAGCHQVRPGVYEFKQTPEVLAALEAEHKGQVGPGRSKLANDFLYEDHNAWVGAAPASDTLRAFGYIDTAPVEKHEKEDTLYLTEALRFMSDGEAKDLPAGLKVYLPKGKYAAHAPFGGTFASLMAGNAGGPDRLKSAYLNRKDSSTFKSETEQRSVLPPPLLREGERVQPDWLYRFLLNPGPVRPTSWMLLRMPKFNMSPAESRALVNYFAAVSKMENPAAGVTYPYVEIPQRDERYWEKEKEDFSKQLARWAEGKGEGYPSKKEREEIEKRAKDKDMARQEAAKKELKELKDRQEAAKKLQDDLKKHKGTKAEGYSRSAFALMTDPNLCLKCHNLGDKTNIKGAQGPNLALAADRLRPEWTERWIANPKRFLTYDPLMPQNFPNSHDPLKWQWTQLYAGPPRQQVRATRDLLMDRRRLADLLSNFKPPKTPPAKGDMK